MQGVILAAGRGTRMENLTDEVPKPMLPVHGKPILAHKLEHLPEEIDEVIFIVGYRAEVIQNYFGEEWGGRKIRYAFQEELNGTAGAIHLVKDLVRGNFLVMMGDDFYAKDDLERLIQYPLAILSIHFDDASAFGILAKDANDNLLEVVERPHGFASGMVNTGAYMLTPEFFKYPPVKISETEYGLPQTLAMMAKETPVKVVEATRWCPIGRSNDLTTAEQFIF